MFNAFFKVIPNFYSCKANVEFTIVCFDGIDVMIDLEASLVLVSGCHASMACFS